MNINPKERKKIEKIDDLSMLRSTFSKRRFSIFNKANELCILSGAKVGLIVFSPAGNKVYSYSHASLSDVINTYFLGDCYSNYVNDDHDVILNNFNLEEVLNEIARTENLVKMEKKKSKEIYAKVCKGSYLWDATKTDFTNLEQVKSLKVKFEKLCREVDEEKKKNSFGAPTIDHIASVFEPFHIDQIWSSENFQNIDHVAHVDPLGIDQIWSSENFQNIVPFDQSANGSSMVTFPPNTNFNFGYPSPIIDIGSSSLGISPFDQSAHGSFMHHFSPNESVTNFNFGYPGPMVDIGSPSLGISPFDQSANGSFMPHFLPNESVTNFNFGYPGPMIDMGSSSLGISPFDQSAHGSFMPHFLPNESVTNFNFDNQLITEDPQSPFTKSTPTIDGAYSNGGIYPFGSIGDGSSKTPIQFVPGEDIGVSLSGTNIPHEFSYFSTTNGGWFSPNPSPSKPSSSAGSSGDEFCGNNNGF